MKPQREHFIPAGAIKFTPKDVNAVVYIYSTARGIFALAFSGKRQKPDFHYSYKSQQRREQNVREYLDRLRKNQTWKDERDAKRRGFKHGYKVGDILHYSWGYEQTNCEFYEVTDTTPGTVTIRQIASETVPGSDEAHGMADQRTAVKGEFLSRSEPMIKRVQFAENGPGDVSMKHGCAHLWDGTPRYCSWYA